MTRADADSWDIASSVGATATMVAAARAMASREPDALIDDPFAEPLVRAVGLDFFNRMLDGEFSVADDDGATRLITTVMAVRTRFFDDFFDEATESGIRQAVILASGLDARAYRLQWPTGTVVYEIDQPEVIEFKNSTMASIGAEPKAIRRAVSIDLREDWPTALRRNGFDDSEPTAWAAEGLLVYLPPDAQDRLDLLHEFCPLDFTEFLISAEQGTGLDALRNAIYQSLDVVRVYTKLPTKKEADYDRPFTLKRGGTLHDVAALVHRDMAASFKYARVWGTGVLAPGTQMKGDYIVHDKDVVEIHA